MQFDFNKDLLDLEDKPVQMDGAGTQHIGKLLARILANQPKGDPIKFMDWAKKLHNCQVINLDRSDTKLLREFIEGNDMLTVLSKSQMIDILDRGKE